MILMHFWLKLNILQMNMKNFCADFLLMGKSFNFIMASCHGNIDFLILLFSSCCFSGMNYRQQNGQEVFKAIGRAGE